MNDFRKLKIALVVAAAVAFGQLYIYMGGGL